MVAEEQLDNLLVDQKNKLLRIVSDVEALDEIKEFDSIVAQLGFVVLALALCQNLWQTAGYGYKLQEIRQRCRNLVRNRLAAWDRHPAKLATANKLLETLAA